MFYSLDPLAEFSTLEVVVCITCTNVALNSKLPSLNLKTWAKQLLGYLPLDVALLRSSMIKYLN